MRFITLLFIFISISNSLFSQEKPNSDNLMKVIMLIDDDLKGNANVIRDFSSTMEFSEKLFIYQEKEKSSTVPFVLNLLVGLGVGSWVQGDHLGGVIGTFGGFVGYVLMKSSPESATTGLMVFLGTYLFDLIRPFSFSRTYNKKLKSAIGLTDKATLNVYPKIDVTEDGRAMPGISLSIGF